MAVTRPLPDRGPQLRSPVARAVVPVLGGLALLAVLAAFTWGIAAFISRGSAEGTERLAPTTFAVGPVKSVAAEVAEDGPLIFAGLNTTTGERTIVLNHTGDDPAAGWEVYYAFPADRDATCPVEQVVGTSTFTDCEGRTLDVTQLSPPDEGVFPIVEDRSRLSIDLRGVTLTTTTTTAAPG